MFCVLNSYLILFQVSPKSDLTSNLILEETASKKDLLLSRLHLSSPEDKSKLLDKYVVLVTVC